MDEYKLIPPPLDPDEEEIAVGPVEAESAAEVLARLERRDRLARYEEMEAEVYAERVVDRPTFSLRQLLIVITVLSVWMGLLRWLSLAMPMLAGLTGVAALVGMFWLSVQENRPAILRVLWWGMLVVYLTCTAATWIAR